MAINDAVCAYSIIMMQCACIAQPSCECKMHKISLICKQRDHTKGLWHYAGFECHGSCTMCRPNWMWSEIPSARDNELPTSWLVRYRTPHPFMQQAEEPHQIPQTISTDGHALRARHSLHHIENNSGISATKMSVQHKVLTQQKMPCLFLQTSTT